MATRCPDCGTDVVEELDYCFGCFRHLAPKPTQKTASAEPKSKAGFIPDDELVDAAPKQTFMTWEPGAIPKGTVFGLAIQDSEWRHAANGEDR